MKHTPLSRISQKQRAIKAREKVLMEQMMKESDGLCMKCGKSAPLEKSHTRDRSRFIMLCRACHSPGGEHRYLEEE